MTDPKKFGLEVLFEDNHLIVINKRSSDISQGDKTGDETLPDKIKAYWKEKYDKPGNVFCGVVHRLDRPTSGVIIFTRTSKALERLFKQFQARTIEKSYWALIEEKPSKKKDTLIHFLIRKEKQNKSYANDIELANSKRAVLHYEHVSSSDNYHLLKVKLETGRHHQIRCQLSKMGYHIKGDVKYGARRANPDLSICLHARNIKFEHPVTKEEVNVTAPVPNDSLWQFFEKKEKVN
ncbi:MAG: 23S rRNA pseudouridine1911/1915/1917 synthase [Psychromonas sp.]|jgi:23S rRNA pseudouridine1911/1915/1917 synthase